MLGKLIKHEFKATARMFFPLLIITAIMTPLAAFMMRMGIKNLSNTTLSSLLSVSFTVLYVITLIGVGMASSIILIIRFYKSMVSDEAYLTHTLPAKTSSILWSKLIVSYIWVIASILLIGISVLSLTRIIGLWTFSQFIDFIRELRQILVRHEINLAPMIITVVFVMLISTATSLLHFYCSISLGQLMKGHRVLGTIIAYIGIYTVVQIVTTIVTSSVALRLERFDDGLSAYNSLIGDIWLIGALSAVLAVIYFVITNYIFKKKLNLE